MLKNLFSQLFLFDGLSILMISLIAFVGATVMSFSYRYLKGDARRGKFFFLLALLILSMCTFSVADNLILFLASLGISNLLLVRLMIHKKSWVQAVESGRMAFRSFASGFFLLMLCFALLYIFTKEISIRGVVSHTLIGAKLFFPLILLLLGVMTQSAIWPFHRWLISSLNSPTPVSALMHAGLINGGGYILIRFAPLYAEVPLFLKGVFVVGIVTALLGNVWKLMQSDVKRMLAHSTMGQMGFMIAQCGLGLFPAAATHLLFHGLFKSYLFLSSGGAAQERKKLPNSVPSFLVALLALGFAFIGCYSFLWFVGRSLSIVDTTFFLLVMVFIAITQIALTVLQTVSLRSLALALLFTVGLSAVYGINIRLVEHFLTPMNLMKPQQMSFIHYASLFVFLLGWVSQLYRNKLAAGLGRSKWATSLYVQMLNASQPDPRTVTALRKEYNYE